MSLQLLKNKLDKWCATYFSSTDSNFLVILGCADKQVFQRIFCTKEWSLTAANHGNNWQSFYGIERRRRPLWWLIPLSYVAYVYEERVVLRPRFEMKQAIECSSYLVITVRKTVCFFIRESKHNIPICRSSLWKSAPFLLPVGRNYAFQGPHFRTKGAGNPSAVKIRSRHMRCPVKSDDFGGAFHPLAGKLFSLPRIFRVTENTACR